jgi:prepilin-type N-terminal cleavage/methylation domain-containing protein
MKNRQRKGLTLIELMITALLMAVLMGIVVFVFITLIGQWSSGQNRAGIDIGMDRGIEEMVRDLREANQTQSSNDEIRFTRDGANYSIYYFYNPSDRYPLTFNQNLYQVKKTAISPGINGTFTYGAGRIVLRDVLKAPTSDLSFANNMVNLDISVFRGNETIRSVTQVRPRNL